MKIILTGLVGALIGYVTNWLAIKMLFRPYKEVRIKGIKIPFTPGLIPKEKARIARSVGKGIGDHLLTEETIQEHLCGKKVDNAIRTWVNIKIKELIEIDFVNLQKNLELTGLPWTSGRPIPELKK